MRKTIRHPDTMLKKQRNDPFAGVDRNLDLHGMLAIEAERVLANTIAMNNGKIILVNHGKGEGVLRSLVRRFCAGDPRVKRMKKGEETLIPGGDGITIIEL
jgi:DNA-nicking Smr family endonuclease